MSEENKLESKEPAQEPAQEPVKESVQESTEDFKPWGMEMNQFCLLMHLSQFTSYIVPAAGLVLPIVMWSTNKDKSEIIDQHGKNILNWMISSVIYIVISMILMLVLIGFVTIFAVIICSIVFSVIGAIKANDGQVYKYPLTITFIK